MLVALPAAMTLASCAGLGQESLLISEQQEVELGAEFHSQLLAEMPEYAGDPAVAAWVTAIGQSIVPSTDRPDLAYHFTVLDVEDINAFAVLGGYVYVTRGLLMSASTGAEVAAVIAHELGHISARHGVQALETYVIAEGLSELLGQGDLGQVVSGAVQVGAGLAYSQDQERESDQLGVQYAFDAGYNPWGLVHFFQYLQTLEGGADPATDPVSSVFSDLGELFSTHPPTNERIQNVKEQLGQIGVGEDEQGLAWEGGDATATDIAGILAGGR
jgi:predicted Zn-dependent protease